MNSGKTRSYGGNGCGKSCPIKNLNVCLSEVKLANAVGDARGECVSHLDSVETETARTCRVGVIANSLAKGFETKVELHGDALSEDPGQHKSVFNPPSS
jgi:hypothetical protein